MHCYSLSGNHVLNGLFQHGYQPVHIAAISGDVELLRYLSSLSTVDPMARTKRVCNSSSP